MKFLKGIGKFFANSIALLLSILFFVILLLFASTKIITNFTTKDNLNALISKIDIMEIKIQSDDSEEKTVKDFVNEALAESNLSEEQRTKIINNPEISKLLGDTLSNFVNYMFYGGDKVNIDSNKIIKIVEDSGYSLNTNDKNNLKNYVNDFNDKLVKTEKGEQDTVVIKEYIDQFNKYTESNKLIGYIIILFVTFYGLLALLKLNFFKPFLYLGIPSLLMGSLLVASQSIKTGISVLMKNDFSKYQDIITNVIAPLLAELQIYGIVLLVIGIILIATYILVRVLKKKYSEPTNEFDMEPTDLINKNNKEPQNLNNIENNHVVMTTNTNMETQENANEKEN